MLSPLLNETSNNDLKTLAWRVQSPSSNEAAPRPFLSSPCFRVPAALPASARTFPFLSYQSCSVLPLVLKTLVTCKGEEFLEKNTISINWVGFPMFYTRDFQPVKSNIPMRAHVGNFGSSALMRKNKI